ncbi:gamma-glutamyl-gamma-aminobutyrate hydrolase family protein [Photobacterium japonica]|uniref:glutamine amidotransferase-related protein n=1 Tax=Photobacterium japonica TaxID=2910235 RepID=UPI003D147A24
MKLGILLCDDVREPLQARHGNYPDMFTCLFEHVDSSICLQFYRVIDGQYPQSLDECDAYLISGSRYSVYDTSRWIMTFTAFIQRLYQQHIPLIGICFGHQMLAWALGGEVARADKGWGIGVHSATFEPHVLTLHSWLPDTLDKYALIVSHQDQILTLPPHSTVLAGSAFCPTAMLLVGDHCLGIQGHPEYTPHYSQDLITLRHTLFPEKTANNALNSLLAHTHHIEMTETIVSFIKSRLILKQH